MAITDIGGATPVIQTGYGNGDGFGFGQGWLGIILIIALLGGGFWGNRDRGHDHAGAAVAAVDRTVYSSQQFNQLDNGIRGLANGICDATFALNNSIKDGNYAIQSAIQGVNTNLGNALCSTTYELANRINAVGGQLSDCCCKIERGQLETNYLNERNTNAVIQNQTANTQRILDYLNCKELADKNQQIFDMSQRAQTAEIISAMKPQAAIPAYLQPSPYSVFYPTVAQSGVNTGCGCNSNVNFV